MVGAAVGLVSKLADELYERWSRWVPSVGSLSGEFLSRSKTHDGTVSMYGRFFPVSPLKSFLGRSLHGRYSYACVYLQHSFACLLKTFLSTAPCFVAAATGFKDH